MVTIEKEKNTTKHKENIIRDVSMTVGVRTLFVIIFASFFFNAFALMLTFNL